MSTVSSAPQFRIFIRLAKDSPVKSLLPLDSMDRSGPLSHPWTGRHGLESGMSSFLSVLFPVWSVFPNTPCNSEFC